MTTIPNTTTVDERDERKRKRAAILKFSLAGAAVLGIGAAATSAAWTDDAWFLASGSAGTDAGGLFEIEGSVGDSDDWYAADTDDAAIEFGLTDELFAGMYPGEERTATLHLRNVSDAATVELTQVPPVVTAGLFTGGRISTTFGDGVELKPNETTSFTVTVKAPVEEWLENPTLGGEEVKDKIGALRYTGTVTSVAPSGA